MSTNVGVIKILNDNQLRAVATTTATTLGAAQAKGTATDLLLTVIAGADGATALSGTVTVAIQGSQVTASAASNWTAVTPDKGTIANITVSGQQVAHFQNLQYAFYRINLTQSVAATADVSGVWAFMPVADSVDATAA